jgi:hypothetical protein
MWSWIAVGLTAWFSQALMTGLVIGRAARLRDLVGAAPAPVVDSPRPAMPARADAAPGRAFARS